MLQRWSSEKSNQLPQRDIKVAKLTNKNTFISEELAKELNLKPVREVPVDINTFMSNHKRTTKFKEYEIIVRAISSNEKLFDCMFLHVTYAFQSESTLYSCLNVKELLARSRREI